jgi:arsenite transporter
MTGKHDPGTVPHPEQAQVDSEKQRTEPAIESKKSVYAGLGWLDRLLVLWILLAIIIGILLGNFVDSVGPALQRGKFVGVSVPIGVSKISPMCRPLTDIPLAVGLLVMMYPILCKVQYETLHNVFAHRQIWIQLGFSIVANWIIAPLLMVSQSPIHMLSY